MESTLRNWSTGCKGREKEQFMQKSFYLQTEEDTSRNKTMTEEKIDS